MTTSPTDRRIRGTSDLDALAFDERGLLPVVVQDASTGRLLMLAWGSRESLEATLDGGTMHFWSRSRQSLWKKGETSGNVQTLVSLHTDCDGDAVLARVLPTGPACHTGEVTCFGLGTEPTAPGPHRFDPVPSVGGALAPVSDSDGASALAELWRVVEARDRDRPQGSYTTRLLEDENLRLKKLGEEVAELISALARGSENAGSEAADLVYHLLVALKGAGVAWTDVEQELARRRG